MMNPFFFWIPTRTSHLGHFRSWTEAFGWKPQYLTDGCTVDDSCGSPIGQLAIPIGHDKGDDFFGERPREDLIQSEFSNSLVIEVVQDFWSNSQ